MKRYSEGAISYVFPDSFVVLRLEDSAYYRGFWQTFAQAQGKDGNKECDFIALDPANGALWLLETKDYRHETRTKPSELGYEFAAKCRDSIGCLAAMKMSPFAPAEEKELILQLFKAKKIRCVIHIEQGVRSKLFPAVIDPKILRDCLRRQLRPLDPHAIGGDATLLEGQIPFDIVL